MTANYNINGNTRGIKAMTKRLSHILTIFGVIGVFAATGFFTVVQAVTLEDISYSVLPGERVQLKIELSEAMQGEPLSFTIDNPARIALDFPNTSLGSGASKNQSIDVGVAHSVSAVETLARPGGRIEPLPEIKPYEAYAYQSAGQDARDPFKLFYQPDEEMLADEQDLLQG